MSIDPVGGVGSAQGHAPLPSVAKPESGEVAGAPDHDGDADDAATQAPAAKASGVTLPGTLNVKA